MGPQDSEKKQRFFSECCPHLSVAVRIQETPGISRGFFFLSSHLRSCQQPPPRGTITRGASARSRASATTIPQSSTGTAQPISTTPLSPAVAAAATAFASQHTSHPPLAPAPFSATRNARGVNGGSSGTTTTPRAVRRSITAGDWSSSRLRSTRRAELMMSVCRPQMSGIAFKMALHGARLSGPLYAVFERPGEPRSKN